MSPSYFLPTVFIDLFSPNQHLPLLRPVCRAKYPCQVQLICDPGGSAVPDLESFLQNGCGCPSLDTDHRRLAEQRVPALQ